MKTLKFLRLIFPLLILSMSVSGQTHRLSGLVMDKSNNTPIIGGIVLLKGVPDSTVQYSALTDDKGRFSVSIRSGNYRLTVQNMSYKKVFRQVTMANQDQNLGMTFMEPDSKVLNEVIVQGQGPVAVQKGDTTEMSSSAYKTNPDATAEDLVKKMPGITVENGTLKAHGEEVKKVFVDGKQFFGDDPSAALKNLPAEVIDKVQVFNKLSEQGELTGVDDGNSYKTLNLVTKQNRRTGQFGKLTAGTDLQNKYILAGNLNIFQGNRRFTILGNLNNVNQQNFSTLDLLGTSNSRGGGGGSGNRMMGGGMMGGGFGGNGMFGTTQSGVTTTRSFGINYNDNWGKKVTVNGSYFYNSTDNVLDQLSNTENLFVTDGKYSSTKSYARTQNYNHRLNMRIEYNIDSLNTLLFIPRLSTQTNNADKTSTYDITGGSVNTSTQNLGLTDASSYNLSGDLIFRHKFMKPRRTFSVGISATQTNRTSKNTQHAVVDKEPDNQFSDNNTDGFTYSANITYSEPVSQYGMLMAAVSTSNNHNETDKETYRLGDQDIKLNRLDSLSNVYNNDYTYNKAGLTYVVKKGNLNFNMGIDYQVSNLNGNQQFPSEGKVTRSFENVLPNMMLMYKVTGKSNLRVFYRTSTNAPSISQLQLVTDNSNRLNLSTGNPQLKQEYSHNLMSNYTFTNSEKGFNSFIVLSGGYTQDYIGYRTIYARKDTLKLPEYKINLQPGGQLSIPVNLDYTYNLRTLVNIGKYVKPIKSNINLLTGFNYSQTPGYIDSLLNRSNSYTITNSLILASNISENLDFTVSYTSNYSIANNTAKSQNISNTKYWYQSANFKINWIFLKGFVLQTDVSGQFNKGLSSNTYNQNYVVWNAGFGRKFLKNNAAELKLSVFDILNQNSNIGRTITATSIQDTRTNTFPRYFMVVFTYNLRRFNGQKEPEQRMGPPRDGMPMTMPLGTPPPGGMQGPPPPGF